MKHTLRAQQKNPAERIKELIPDEQEITLTSRDRLRYLPKWLQEFVENLTELRSISSGSVSREQPEPPRPDNVPAKAPKGKHNSFTHFSQRPQLWYMQAYESYINSLQTEFTKSHTPRNKVWWHQYCWPESLWWRRIIAEQSQVCNCHARFGHSTDSKLPRVEQKHHKKRRKIHGRLSIPKKIQRLYTQSILWNLDKLVKIFKGFIVRLPLIGWSWMELRKEHKEESKRTLHPFFCSLHSMKGGPHNLWNVVAIYAILKINYQIRKLHMNDDLKNNSVGQVYVRSESRYQ